MFSCLHFFSCTKKTEALVSLMILFHDFYSDLAPAMFAPAKTTFLVTGFLLGLGPLFTCFGLTSTLVLLIASPSVLDLLVALSSVDSHENPDLVYEDTNMFHHVYIHYLYTYCKVYIAQHAHFSCAS